jgi:predicted RNA-binding protein
MCLSSVYLEKKSPESLIMEEASLVTESRDDVFISSLFGEKKTLAGHSVAEVNLLEHYVIIKKQGRHDV